MALPEIIPNKLLAITEILPEPPVARPATRWPILINVSAPPVPDNIAPKIPNMARIVADNPSIVPQIPVVP